MNRRKFGAETPSRIQLNKPRWEISILMVIVALGLILRLFYLMEIARLPDFDLPSLDAYYHDYYARGVVSGHWTVKPGQADPQILTTPYYRPPGYPYFLATVYSMTGISSMGARVVQAVMGMLNILLLYWLVRRWAGAWAALFSSALMSFYWPAIYFDGELVEPVLMVFTSLLLLHALARIMESKSPVMSALAGLLFGFGVLIRPNLLLFYPFAIVWLVWVLQRSVGFKKLSVLLGTFSVSILLPLLPVVVRNYQVSRTPIISCNGQITFYYGNNELADGLACVFPEMQVLSGAQGTDPCRYPELVESLSEHLGRPLSYSEANAYWFAKALDYIRKNPGEFAELTWQKILLFLSPYELSNSKSVEGSFQNVAILRILPIRFPWIGAMAGLGILLFISRPMLRQRLSADRLPPGMDANIGMLLLSFLASYFLSVIFFLVDSRLRMPAVPILMAFSGTAGASVLWMISRRMVLWLATIPVAAIFYLVLSIHWTPHKPDVAKWHHSQGVAYTLKGDNEKAISEFEKSLRLNPQSQETLKSAGSLYSSFGNHEKSIDCFLEATRLDPLDAESFNQLGMIFGAVQDFDRAVDALQKTVGLRPRYGEAWYNLGSVLSLQGKIPEAIASYRKTLDLAPNDYEAAYQIARLYEKEQKVDDALMYYEKVLQINSRYTPAIEAIQRISPDGAVTHPDKR